MRTKLLTLTIAAGLCLVASPAVVHAQRVIYRGYDSRDYDRAREDAIERATRAREQADRARERALERAAELRERANDRARERADEQNRRRWQREAARAEERTNRQIHNELRREFSRVRVTAPRIYYRNW